MRKALVLVFVASFVALVACGGGGKGDSCEEEGKVAGECDQGFVCGRANADNSGELVCLIQCSTEANCPSNDQCNDVGKTSLKGCRTK